MILPTTEVTSTAEGIVFTTATAHGAQVVKVLMSLREPKILPSVVTLESGELFFRPLALSFREIEEFFLSARNKWSLTHETGLSDPSI